MSGAPKQKPILCLDWDGVVHNYTSGWQGADVIPDGPVPGAMEFIVEAQQFFTIAIYSSRSGQDGGIIAMQDTLSHWLFLHILSVEDPNVKTTPQARDRVEQIKRSIQWPTEKPAAFITIDDRALTFCGVWPNLQELRDFKPWNKRGPAASGLQRFRRRHTEIVAVQWTGGEQTHPRVRAISEDESIFVPDGDVGTARGFVIIPGDWIVTDPAGGGCYVVQESIFARRYEAMP